MLCLETQFKKYIYEIHLVVVEINLMAVIKTHLVAVIKEDTGSVAELFTASLTYLR